MLVAQALLSLEGEHQLLKTEKKKESAFNKLSTGRRINKAADDASGLAISQTMTAQLRGLKQASRNVQDGASLIQIAEQGLASIDSPTLQRMRELAVHAGDGALTDQDRQAIQAEIDQLKQHIDDIAMKTNFNGIDLLHVPDPFIVKHKGIDTIDYSTVLSLPTASPSGRLDFRTNLGYPNTVMDDHQALVYGSGGTSLTSVSIDGNVMPLTGSSSSTVSGGVYSTTFITPNNIVVTQSVQIVQDKYEIRYSVQNNDSTAHNVGVQFNLDTQLGGDDQARFSVNGTTINDETAFAGTDIPNSFTVYNHTTNPELQAQGVLRGPGILVEPDRFGIAQYTHSRDHWNWSPSGSVGDSEYSVWWNERSIAPGSSFTVNTFYGLSIPSEEDFSPTGPNVVTDLGDSLTLQVGARSDQNMKIPIVDARSEHLGVDKVFVGSYNEANQAITTIDEAIAKVSTWRARYGAYQNGLEHASNNLANSSENTASALSRIADADMAQTMVAYTKESILSQATQAMMAKANQQPQQVLQLLQG